jgi:hypothetical protein
MIPFDTLTWHYTATFDDQDIGIDEIRDMHLNRGFKDVGYHAAIRLGGAREWGRPMNRTGAHVGGHNTRNLGFVTVGGLQHATGSEVGVDTRTREQRAAQVELTKWALETYPTIKRIVGHRDLANTQCPAYDVAEWWARETGGRVPAARLVASDTPAVSYALTRRGSTGKTVRALQDALNGLGHKAGAVDGVFGFATERAVREFQSANGLPADGLVGPATWTQLAKVGRS